MDCAFYKTWFSGFADGGNKMETDIRSSHPIRRPQVLLSRDFSGGISLDVFQTAHSDGKMCRICIIAA